MLEYTKEIVVALINSGQICRHNISDKNIDDVKFAIKEIYQELLNTKYKQPEISNEN